MENVHYVMERMGTEATEQDAQMVIELAESIAAEQGDEDFNLIDWLHNRTYGWTLLWEAANGDVAALAKVRAEAHLPVIGPLGAKMKTTWINSAGFAMAIADSKQEACQLWLIDVQVSLDAGLSSIDDYDGVMPEYKTQNTRQIVSDRVSHARDQQAPGWDEVMQAAKDGRLFEYQGQ